MTAMQRFSRGEPIPVEIDEIERELRGLWQAASRQDVEGAAPPERGMASLSRAALWNLIVPTHGAALLARTKKMLAELAPSLPARALVLFEEPGAPAEGEACDLIRATIESNVVSRAGGTRIVYSEQITLSGPPGVDEHFGALVRALQIPGLPTATLWLDPAMPEGLLRGELLPVTDRLIVDTGGCDRPARLLGLRRLADSARGGLVLGDLGWLRLASYRLLFAGLFDPPVGGGPLARARRVTIHHRGGADVSALLLAAWLAVRLGWRAQGAAAAAGGGLDLRFAPGETSGAAAGPAPIEVALVPSPERCGTSGIIAIELRAAHPRGGEEVYAVRRTAEDHAELTLPIAPPRVVKLDSRSDAELCVAALGPAGRDPLMFRSLECAAELIELNPRG
jgi:glucose-6-phosphate dehydrogenase assembly protein OpcA